MANARVSGRPVAPLVLSAQERAYLERQVRRHRVARSLSERCASFSDVRTAWRARRGPASSAYLVDEQRIVRHGESQRPNDIARCSQHSMSPRDSSSANATSVVERRVLELSQRDRCSSPRRARYPHRHGQLCHLQDAKDQGMACPSAALSFPDQSGRELVCVLARKRPVEIFTPCRAARSRYPRHRRSVQP